MVETMRKKGDKDGADVWLRIIVAIGTLGKPATSPCPRVKEIAKGSSPSARHAYPESWRDSVKLGHSNVKR
jgi:hypothetical protein